MIEQYARVATLDSRTVRLQPETQTTGCHSCSLSAGCGTSLIARWLPERLPHELALPIETMPQSVQTGDRVLLGIHEDYLHRAIIMLYALPLCGLIGGALLGAWLAESFYGPGAVEPASILTGLLGLIAGITFAHHQSVHYANRLQRHMQVVRVMPATQVTWIH